MTMKNNDKRELSIVFPIYNEKKNIRKLIKEIKQLNKQNFFDLEIIFVNDGSTDNTKEILENYLNKLRIKKKIISYKENKGKGYAIKLGILSSKGQWILTSDADLSVSLKHIVKWFKNKRLLKKNYAYFASRNHKYSQLKAHLHRKIIGFFYQLIFKILFINSISYLKDTQCGFKLYNKSYAKKIFSKVKENGFIHDIEIAILLHQKNINMEQMPVKWIYGKSTKVNLFTDSILMFFKIFYLKLKYKI